MQLAKLPSGYKQTEVGVIPADWEVRPLEGLASFIHGFAFQSNYFCDSGDYKLTTPGHFYESGGFRELGDKQKYYSGPIPTGYVLSKGDLIVAMTEQADGLLGSAAIIPEDCVYLHNQRLGRLRLGSPSISCGYLYRVFNSPLYRRQVRETAAGTKVKHTSPKKLTEILIPLPPTLAEQEAIAGALSDADALIELLEQLVFKKRQIKHGAMQELLTGQKRLPGFTGKWETKRLGSLCSMKSGEGITAKNIDSSSPFPCYGGNGLRGFTTRFTHDGNYCLIGRVGALCGNLLEVKGQFFASEHAIVVASIDSVDISWLTLALGTLRLNGRAESSAQPVLTVSKLLPIEMVVPVHKAEQTAIAAILSDMDSEIAALETKLAKARQVKQGMMQKLLTGRIRLI